MLTQRRSFRIAHKRLAAALESWNREMVKPLWLDHIQDRDQLIKK
jgi:hypothetical protein